MTMSNANRIVWVVCAILAGLVLVGLGVLVKPYGVAQFRGYRAELGGAVLIYARLAGTDMNFATLRRANLTGADLRKAHVMRAALEGAILQGADLTDARLIVVGGSAPVNLSGANFSRANLTGAELAGAHYDAHTRWPAGFDPRAHGAVKVP